MAMKKKSSRVCGPIKYHGGKYYLAHQIVAMLPEHTHYVEPYYGGGAVLLAKPAHWVEGHSEVVNDINGKLTNFWKVIGDEHLFTRFYTAIQMLPLSEAIFREAKARLKEQSSGWLRVEDAIDFFTVYRQSRQGLGKDFATLSKTRTRSGMNEQASAWLGAIDGLPEAHERMRRVVVLNRDAIDVIKSEDTEHTCFYLDPPYLPETRAVKDSYEFEMTPEQHEELLTTLEGIEGKFLLSGYPSSMYESFASRNGWQCERIEIDNKSSSAKVKEKKIEVVWRNY